MAFAMPPLSHQQQYPPPAKYYHDMHSAANAPLYAQPRQFSNYQPDQHVTSPISAPPTPSTVSPNSQQILLHKKGPVAKTLYTPAALRPTQNPKPKNASALPNAPITPPASLQSSLDSLDKNLPQQKLVNRRNTGDSAKSGLFLHSVALNEEGILRRDPEAPGYSRVTEFPTKTHWKPDSTTTVCADPLCQREFTIFNRRHHCRRCGNIFCAVHSSNLIPLNQDVEFHPHGNRVRGCDACWTDYTAWEIKRQEIQSQRLGKIQVPTHSTNSLPSLVTSPQTVIGFSGEAARRRQQSCTILPMQIPPFLGNANASSQIAASVPGNHDWSTF